MKLLLTLSMLYAKCGLDWPHDFDYFCPSKYHSIYYNVTVFFKLLAHVGFTVSHLLLSYKCCFPFEEFVEILIVALYCLEKLVYCENNVLHT